MSGYYLYFETILRRLKALSLVTIALALGIGAIAYLSGSEDRERDTQRILWARTYVQESVEGLSGQWLTVDSFDSLSVEPNPEPQVWNISGRVVAKGRAGDITSPSFVVAVRNLCRSYRERRCWELTALNLANQEIPIEILGGHPLVATAVPNAKLFGIPSTNTDDGPQAQLAEAQAKVLLEAKFPPLSTIESVPTNMKPTEILAAADGRPVTDPNAELAAGQAVAMLSKAATRSRPEAEPAAEPDNIPADGEVANVAPPVSTKSSTFRPKAALALPSTKVVPDPVIPLTNLGVAPESPSGRVLIASIQRHLQAAGFATGPIDGIMGPRTRRAIESYQRSRGLAVRGRPTQALLFQLEQDARSPQFAGPGNDEAAVAVETARSGELKFPQGNSPVGDPQVRSAEPLAPRGEANFENLSGMEPDAWNKQARAANSPHLAEETQLAGLTEPGKFNARLIADVRYLSDLDRTAMEAVKQGALDRAIALYTYAIAAGYMSREALAVAYNNRGAAYEQNGIRDLAAADYSQAIRLNPALDEAYYNRGRLQETDADRHYAMQDFSQAYTLNPGDREYRVKMIEYGSLQ